MAASSPAKKILELQANTTAPRGATIRLTVEYRIRPSTTIQSGPTYEGVSMEKFVDVDMGTNGQYKQQAKYKYENEIDMSSKQSTIEHIDNAKQAHIISTKSNLIPETIVEHISEDEKSISSEEAFFEEWNEEFPCRRTDEYDSNTNKLIRTTIDETGERIKSDVIKEEYREKNVRIKGHKSYDIVKQVYPSELINISIPMDQIQTHVYEEIPQPPLSLTQPTTISSSSQDRHWTSEDIYTTEIVYDPTLAKNIESTVQKFDSSSLTTNIDRVRPRTHSPLPSTTHAKVSTTPSEHYDRISNILTPPTTLQYATTQKHRHEQEPEEVISEEYHIEIETPKKQEDTDNTYDQQSPTRRDSDWRKKLKDLHTSTSEYDRSNQYEKQINGSYTAQRVSVIPSYTQQQKKKNLTFLDSEDSKRITSISSFDDDRSSTPKYSPSSASILNERQTQYEQNTNKIDRPAFSRVEQLKNAFETASTTTTTTAATNEIIKHDTLKYATPITTGLTEQRRKVFEEQQEQTNNEWTGRPINEFHSNERRISETCTAPSIVSNRISHIENIQSKSTSRVQPTDRLGRTGFDAIKSTLESSITPQTSIDIKLKNKQVVSSIDSDLSRPLQPIYQSTPKTIKQKFIEDDGHESEDELSDPKQVYDKRQRTSKARLRDFSQSTSQPIDTNHFIQRTTTTTTTSKFNEGSMENILSHVPISKGKAMLIELSPSKSQSPIRSIHDQTKSNITTDSGVYEHSTVITHQYPVNSPVWRHNVSTSVLDDVPRTRDSGVYVDSPPTTISSYSRRQGFDADQTITQNIDDSISRSTYKYDTEISPGEPINQQQQQQRTVRRHITNSLQTDYEPLANYQSGIGSQNKIPITTQSRSIKPLVVDEVETIETETQVECQVQRTNEIKESTKTERTTSPMSSPKKIPTTPSRSPYTLSNEITPAKRVLLNDRPQYYESPRINNSTIQDEESVRVEQVHFKPIERVHSQDNLRYIRPYNPNSNTIEVTSLSPQSQVTFGKRSPNEIIAVVNVPELINDRNIKTNSPRIIRHGISETELYEKSKNEDERSRLHYQRVHATSYLPSPTNQNYQQRQSRPRFCPSETTHEYSSPINFPTRSASYHSSLHEQNQQQQQQQQQPFSSTSKLTSYPQTRYQSSSLGNLFGGNLDFEIEIEKRPPQQPQQPTVVSLDQCSRAIVTTSKDGRVSIQNIAAQPGNTVIINSDFHSSDRSLNRSSGYFSSDEFRSQNFNTNYSSDEQSIDTNQNSPLTSLHTQNYKQNISYNPSKQFDQINHIVQNYSTQSPNSSTGFNEAIDQIDALYNNLDIQTYDFSKPTSTINRRKQLSQNSDEYSKRYTSTGFQHIPYEQQTMSNIGDTNDNWTTSSLTNLVMSTPIRPTQSLSSSGNLADYGTSRSISPHLVYDPAQRKIVQQNRLNDQSQLVQRNRTSVKQIKQKSAAKKRYENIHEHYSDEDNDNNESAQLSTRYYDFSHHY